MLQVSIYRYNPDIDTEPRMEDFQLDTGGKDLMVLDVMEMIKAQDTSFAYRRSCREGVCGSDGVNMNGLNGLACITPLSDTVRDNKLVLRPLPGLEIDGHAVYSWRIVQTPGDQIRDHGIQGLLRNTGRRP